MVDWRRSKWGDEIRLEYGKALRDYSQETGKYRVFGANGPVGWTNVPLAHGPGVILGRKGAYRGVQYCREPFFVIDTAYFAAPLRPVDMRWLYYAMIHYRLGDIDDGSPIPSTTRAAVYVQDLLVPPVEEQRRISKILGSLDDKIHLNRRMNETLEATARTIFKDWFVDFGPVRAKMDGRSAYLASEVWSLFPDRLNEGGIPKGWTVQPLDQIASFLNGLALQKFPPTGEHDLPVIKIAQLRAGSTAGSDWAGSTVPPEYVIEDGDVLFSWSGSLMQRIWTGGRGALNQHLFKVSSRLVPRWMHFLWVEHHLPAFRAIAASKATTMGHIQRHHLSEAEVIMASPALHAAADTVIRPLFDRYVLNELESRTLGSLRDLLLPKLMSGAMRIRDAEIAVEAVA